MQSDFLSPLSLVADPFKIGVDGAQSSPDATQLLNPNHTAMLVDEIKVNVGPVVGGFPKPHEFASVVMKLGFGSTPLTNDFIPMLSIMPYYFLYAVDATLTWHFARPLYVPPNVQLTATFMRKNPFVGVWETEYDVDQLWGFGINGRSMPSGMAVPSMIDVPWACATSVYAEGGVAPSNFVSKDSDIANPHDVPLNIDYFAGFNMGEDNTVLKTPITFQATLSNNKVLARDPIPFGVLFPPDRALLRVRGLLQPKEFVSVVLDIPQPIASQNENLIFTTVGMTGWREMPTPLGAIP